MIVPRIKLNNGVEIPVIGNGPAAVGYTPTTRNSSQHKTFLYRVYNKLIKYQIQKYKYIDAVAHSFNVGFTLLDDSASYYNDPLIYQAINKSIYKREDLFITTRASNNAQICHKVREEFFNTLKALHTNYIDLYQFHWPVTGYYLGTWREMVNLYKEGYCKAIGVANCNQHHILDLMEISDVVPAIDQFEVHPLFTQKELISFCKSKGIVVEAYTPLARFDDRLVRLPLLKNLAKKYNKTIPQIVLRWDIQNGIIPIVRSLNKQRQIQNISIFDFKLSIEEMKAIDGININSRLRYDPDNCDFSIL